MRRLSFIFFLFFLFCSSVLASEKRYFIPIENSPYIGSENAPVTIIEFIDYQ